MPDLQPLKYCAVSECEFPAEARELCGAHYQQVRRSGRVTSVKVRRRSAVGAALARLWRHGYAVRTEEES